MEKQPGTHSSQEEQVKNDKTLFNNLHEIWSQAYEKSENRNNLHDSMTEFAQGLQKKYSDVRSRKLWHLLIGSTPPSEIETNMEDYPGEDSIVQFIEGLK